LIAERVQSCGRRGSLRLIAFVLAGAWPRLESSCTPKIRALSRAASAFAMLLAAFIFLYFIWCSRRRGTSAGGIESSMPDSASSRCHRESSFATSVRGDVVLRARRGDHPL
jgi:hypothetical protein